MKICQDTRLEPSVFFLVFLSVSFLNENGYIGVYFFSFSFSFDISRDRECTRIPFASPPPGDVQRCQSIPAGPIMPRSVDSSDRIGGVPFQRVWSHVPADHALHAHIPPHRLRRLAEAVRVPWDLPEVEPGGFFQDSGEEFVRKAVDCRLHSGLGFCYRINWLMSHTTLNEN